MMPSSYKQVVCFDLDDTLYKEVWNLKSAFKEVANFIAQHSEAGSDAIYEALITLWSEGKSPFQEISTLFPIKISIEECLHIYREHKPSIHLDEETQDALNTLRENDCTIGLITDGRSITQRNKIEALGLCAYIADCDIIISEEFGSEKPSTRNYSYFMEKYPHAAFTYVGDNLAKDFIAPRALGWKTICLLDNGENIHKQDLFFPKEYEPDFFVKSINEVMDLIIEN